MTHVWKTETEARPQRPQAAYSQDLAGQKKPLSAAHGVHRVAGQDGDPQREVLMCQLWIRPASR